MTKRTLRAIGLAALTLLLGSGVVAVASGTASGEVGSSDWKMVSGGESHTCGIRTSGELYCWGANGFGQLGDDSMDQRLAPTRVAGSFTDWVSVSAGGLHTCALRSTGRLYCWGYNGNGRLGVGDLDFRDVPTEVAGGFTNWTSVDVGSAHSCGRRSTGRLYCWGANVLGALGTGDKQERLTPTEVTGRRTDWSPVVSAGGYHTCARRTTGRLYCWGRNDIGLVGNGNLDEALTPQQVAGAHTDWTTVSAGGTHTCGRRTSGRLYCWGADSSGQLGNGGGDARSTPGQVAGSLTSWTTVSAGGEHTCARRSTGRLFCWGDSSNFGQVGDRSFEDRQSPVQVAGGATDWKTLGIGDYHTCATTTSGRAYCWGRGGDGQLGRNAVGTDGTPAEVYSP